MLTDQRAKRASAIALAGLLALASWAWAQGHMGHADTAKPPAPAPSGHGEHSKTEAQASLPQPIRITMEELHRQGGVPAGWRFLLPPGDPAEGRKVYIAMECFTCHEIKGEDFPKDTKNPGMVGPELTGVERHHPAEYFAEAILNPNRVIIEGPGYTGPDGLSKMPDYTESLTLRQLIDLVAYLKSLTTGEMEHGGHSLAPQGSSGGHGGKSH